MPPSLIVLVRADMLKRTNSSVGHEVLIIFPHAFFFLDTFLVVGRSICEKKTKTKNFSSIIVLVRADTLKRTNSSVGHEVLIIFPHVFLIFFLSLSLFFFLFFTTWCLMRPQLKVKRCHRL